MRDFVELGAKSNFSFLLGASHPEEMVETAKDLGYRGLALCDINGFYGMVRAHDRSRQLLFTHLAGVEICCEETPLIFIPKCFDGYKRLCRLLSEAYREAGSEKGKPIFLRAQIEKWIDSQVIHSFLTPTSRPKASFLQWLRAITPLTQLVTRTLHPDQDQSLQRWLRDLHPSIPRAWSWMPTFHHPSRFELSEVLEAIRENTTLREKRPRANGEGYLKPLNYLDAWGVPKEWTDQTLRIAETCDFSPKQIKYEYPQEWLPAGKTSFEFLRELCERGLKIRYPKGAGRDVLEQLQHELGLVQELHFEDYFLTVWDIVQYARSQKILCQGRGSAANSIVCYLLEVTSIDPVRMNLLFERFISRERNEAPDIDVDFEHERREEVIQYVYQKYGRDRAGMVATLITFRTKSAFREVGKVLEVPPETLDRISKQVSWREKPSDFLRELPWAQEHPLEAERWLRLAYSLKGFPRHLGQHTGGMILTQGRLDEMSPIEPASMPGRSVIQWDKYDIEKLGLLKIDLLSLGMLTCIRKTFDLLKSFAGLDLELHTIPADDPKTFDMIGQARTVGVFQIESRAQMSMLPRLKPRNFYDLVVEVAIVRPGPIQGGMVHPYLRRRLGLEKVTYVHPKLRPILEKTLGVPIFQEQVMKMAIEVAGYAPGEADELRRAMGAWKRSGNLEKHAAEMSQRMIARGVPADFSAQVCQQILGFGEYGFPESHAASFALLTYASAYLKAHHPEAFLCSLLNSMPMGFYSLHVLTSSFQKEGVKILPIHTEVSDWDHQLERMESGQIALRLGFRIIQGLQKNHVEEFVKERSKGRLDLFIFDQDERGALALATEEIDRRMAYWKALNPHREEEREIRMPALTDMKSMFLDFEVFETTLKEHPAALLKRQHWNYLWPRENVSNASDLAKSRLQTVTVFGVIQVIQSPPTAKGMFFVTMDDETGFLNLVLQPQIYKRYKHLLQSQWGLLVTGRLQNQSGALSILVNHIHSPQLIVSKKSIREIHKPPCEKDRGRFGFVPHGTLPLTR